MKDTKKTERVNRMDFIQIGANVGKTPSDILWRIVRYYGWSGIFIEPLLSSFLELKKNYSDLTNCGFENVAISDYDGEINIYSDSRSLYNNQQASTNKKHWKADQINLVACITLETLITGYRQDGKEFGLLQIDTEGDDGKILLSTDFDIVCPNKIRFEKCHLDESIIKQVVSHLEDFGYEEIDDEYGDLVIAGEAASEDSDAFDMMFKKVSK